MSNDVGRVAEGDQALAVPATPLRVDGPTGFDPSRDQLWPFGHGVLVTASGVESGVGVLVIRPAPDGLTRDEGGAAFDAWEASQSIGAPQCALTFSSAASVRLFAAELHALAIAIEARSGETAKHGSTEGESAAIAQGDPS